MKTFSSGTSRRVRMLPLVAAGAIVLLTSACTSDTGGSDPLSTNTESEAESPSAEPEDESEPSAQGPSGDPVKIGVVTTLSGGASLLGIPVRIGAEIARDVINENGGILGRPVELIIRDDGNDPAEATNHVRELVQSEGIVGMLGPTSSGTVLASVDPLNEAGIPAMMIISTVDYEPRTVENGYRIFFTNRAFAQAAATDMMGNTDNVGILAEASAYGDGFVTDFQAFWEENGFDGKITIVDFAGDAQDLTTQVQELAREGAEDVFITTPAKLPFATQAAAAIGYEPRWISTVSTIFPSVRENAGDAVDGAQFVYYDYPFATELQDDPSMDLSTTGMSEEAIDFYQRWSEMVDLGPLDIPGRSVYAIPSHDFLSYDGLMMLAEAFNEVGSFEPEAVVEYLDNNSFEGLAKTYRPGANDHELFQPEDASLGMIDEGKIVFPGN